MLFAYWEGLPDSGWCHIDVQSRLSLMSSPAEDGIHLLSVAGPPELTRGSAEQREAAYLAALQAFPATFDPHLLDGARRVSPLVVVPETMLRGFVRPATGPGWVLVGDAGLFKHPVTAQGIGDALAQASYVGTALGRGDDLRDYAAVAGRAGRRPLRVVLRARPVPFPGRCGRVGRARGRPRRGPGVPRHLRAAAPPRCRPQPCAPSPVARGVGLREGPRRAPGPARWPRRRRPSAEGPGLPRLDRGRPARPPRRGRRGHRPRGLLRRGDGGLARPDGGRGAGRLDRRAPAPVRRPWARRPAGRAARARMPGRPGAAQRRGAARVGSAVDGVGARRRPRGAPGRPA